MQIELIVVGVYLAILIGSGFLVSHMSGNISDYFRTGCQGPWWLVGTSCFVAGISARTFTGNAGATFEAGPSVLWIYAAGTTAALVQWGFFAHRFRQLRCITYPEVIRYRFGDVTGSFFAYYQMITFLAFAAFWLWGIAIFASTIFGVNLQLVIGIVGITVLVYSTSGGSWAVMVTDLLQGMLLVPMALALTLISIVRAGGFDGIVERVRAADLPANYFDLFKDTGAFDQAFYSLPWAAAMFCVMLVYNTSFVTAVKYFGAKDGREAKRSALFQAVLYGGGTIIWFVPPFIGRLLYPDEVKGQPLSAPSESVYAIVSQHLLPTGLLGLMLVAMFAATMSSMDTGLNRNAGIFIRDVMPPILRRLRLPLPEGRRELAYSRAATFVFGIIIIGIAMYYSMQETKGLFELTMDIQAMLGLPLVGAAMMGVLVKRVPRWAAMFSAGCAFLPSAYTVLAQKGVLPFEPLIFHEKVFAVIGINVLAFLSTKLFYHRTSDEEKQRVETFFATMNRPVDFRAEVGEDRDPELKKAMGYLCLAAAGLIALILLVPNSAADRLVILGVLAVPLAAGLWFRRSAKRQARERQALAGADGHAE